MRDKSHNEQIERWAKFVRTNKDWKKHLTPFLDSQIIMARRAHKKILALPNGKSILKQIRRIPDQEK